MGWDDEFRDGMGSGLLDFSWDDDGIPKISRIFSNFLGLSFPQESKIINFFENSAGSGIGMDPLGCGFPGMISG